MPPAAGESWHLAGYHFVMKPISEAAYLEGRQRRFGRTNPDRVRVEFWEWMVRTGHTAWKAREVIGVEPGAGPDWCFHRFGMSKTELPDGRVVFIGGEHEDFYDSDFCIYNDVTVVDQNGEIEFFTYPEMDFPPADFHSATPIDDSIYIIGSVGYQGTRVFGITPVRLLDLRSMMIQTLRPSGDCPGWIARHSASHDPVRNVIDILGGKVAECHGDRETTRNNVDRFRLDLASLRWTRVQWTPGVTEWRLDVRDDHGTRKVCERVDRSPIPDAMAAKAVKEPRAEEHQDRWRLRWRGVWIEVTNEWDHAFYLVVRGELPADAIKEMLSHWCESLTEWRGVKPLVKRVWPPEDGGV